MTEEKIREILLEHGVPDALPDAAIAAIARESAAGSAAAMEGVLEAQRLVEKARVEWDLRIAEIRSVTEAAVRRAYERATEHAESVIQGFIDSLPIALEMASPGIDDDKRATITSAVIARVNQQFDAVRAAQRLLEP